MAGCAMTDGSLATLQKDCYKPRDDTNFLTTGVRMKRAISGLLALASACSFAQSTATSQVTNGPGTATPASTAAEGDALMYQRYLRSTRKMSDLDKAAAATFGDPVVGPVLVIGAAFLGVPPNVVATLAGASASALRDRAATQSKGQWDTYTYQPPEGYKFCAVKVYGDSIRPESKHRPKIFRAIGTEDSMTFTITHEKHVSSAVKLRLEMLAIKESAWSKFSSECQFDKQQRVIIPLCHGGTCARFVTGAAWLPVR